MPEARPPMNLPADPIATTCTLAAASGLRIECLGHGGLGRIDAGDVSFNLFPGDALESGMAQLWLRVRGSAGIEAVPLLGPGSPLGEVWLTDTGDGRIARGQWHGLGIELQLRLSQQAQAWFWHVLLLNEGLADQTVDLMVVHDVGLTDYGAVRTNEHYVSHYVDLSPLEHPRVGTVLAARQNQPVRGRHPWAVLGALRHSAGWATDALQVQGLGLRAGGLPQGVREGLPSRRLQHEHALLAVQDAAQTLKPGQSAGTGFFVQVLQDHPAATGPADLAQVDACLALPEARPYPRAVAGAAGPVWRPAAGSLFALAPWCPSEDLSEDELQALFGTQRLHEEREDGRLLSFFTPDQAHVVLREKELHVVRPHGHILRSGLHGTPDETALTSTVWMGGVFHSMVTQGHVGINRVLSTVRGMVAPARAPGQRVFIDVQGRWQQLGLPSAFVIEPTRCRWIYRTAGRLIELVSAVEHAPHALTLQARVLAGPPLRWRVSHHLALGGDDGRARVLPPLQIEGQTLVARVPAGSDLARRFPQGLLRIEVCGGHPGLSLGADGPLFIDGRSQDQPVASVTFEDSDGFGLRLTVDLVAGVAPPALTSPWPRWQAPDGSPAAPAAQQLADMLPWLHHNAMVHYLSPRGLEQYSGGGWGTRDVCQGPLEMLLALGHVEPVRDLLCRTFSAQNLDGDWPQWFMFFERERDIRAGDAHGDIVFWPLLGLAQYLLASGDAGLLEQPLPFHAGAADTPTVAPLRAHVRRALALIAGRVIPGTALAAYGHGDWNDSLQPADPALREHLCSAWTVTLHHQTLSTLAQALRALGLQEDAAPLEAQARAVQADFQRWLVIDGVVAGYVLFEPGAAPVPLLHPADPRTGVHFSLLPMMHAILEGMFTPQQVADHLRCIQQHLLGPDGARLFDRPLPYRGGPQRLFQRAESSAFFGREIGVMYMHAHLRYAQALAHVGDAQGFFRALSLAHPIGLRERVPQASPRQANCYYSSSDAAFADRYEAHADYPAIQEGRVGLDGGWRIYSSGPGIALGLVVRHFLGWRLSSSCVTLDPVMPPALDGLRATVDLDGHELELRYRVGPAGHGPVALSLDGTPLDFQRVPHAYRQGGAQLDRQALRARLVAGARTLTITTG